MPNKNYLKGYRKERKLVNEARQKGNIAFRSAGSHSPVDVVIIDSENNKISLVQCKSDNFADSAKERLLEQYEELNGVFEVEFKVR